MLFRSVKAQNAEVLVKIRDTFLDLAREDAKSKGRNQVHARIVFDVFTGNDPAKSFYESNDATFLSQTEFELGGKTYPTDCYEIAILPSQ